MSRGRPLAAVEAAAAEEGLGRLWLCGAGGLAGQARAAPRGRHALANAHEIASNEECRGTFLL